MAKSWRQKNGTRDLLFAPSLCLLRQQLTSPLAPWLLHPLPRALSPLSLESSFCKSNGVIKPLIVLTHVQFTMRPVMGIHFGGQYSCQWNSFSPGAHGFSLVLWQKLSCLASAQTGEQLLLGSIHELVILPRALRREQDEMGQITGSGKKTVSPLQ